MSTEVSLCFPEKQPLGSLYTADQSFPHQRKWIGEARGTVALVIPEGKMLGVALGSLGWEGVAKTEANDLAYLQSLDVSTCHFNDRSLGGQTDLSTLAEIRLDYLKIGDAEVRLLKRFPNLQTIWLTGTDVTDGGLRELQAFDRITNVVLKSTRVTDQGLANMGELRSLCGLNLPAKITDKGMQYLKFFPNLKRLDASYTKISSDGLKPLNMVTGLIELYLNDT